jgi:FMN-dependent NADH-azoreductase
MNILLVSCSPRGQSAESYLLAQNIVGFLLRSKPAATLTERAIGSAAMPHIDAEYALAQRSPQSGTAGDGSLHYSEQLIQELELADAVVIGTPMHNLTVPSALKAWIDHVVRAGRTFTVGPEGKRGVLRDRPVFVAVASGGRYSGERARQPDFLTPYLKAILGTVGLHDVTFFSVPGTGLGPDAIAEARANADQALQAHFSGTSFLCK